MIMSHPFVEIFEAIQNQPPPTGWKLFKRTLGEALFVALLVGPWLFGIVWLIVLMTMGVGWLLGM